MLDRVFSSTTQLAAAIRAGHVSATDVLAAYLTQIDRYNPALNAVVILDAEQAQHRAREADNALARRGVGSVAWRALTLKDAHATSGLHATTG